MVTDRFAVETDDRLTCIDITDRVASALPEGADGAATVFAEHTTCGITVNEAERRLCGDVEAFLADLVPDEGWAHDEIDDNADSHLRASLIGPSVTVPVEDGRLGLGTWQSVLLVECDGPRRRTVSVTVP
jgi:secondary thiamine-phosphate synthase enzyme